MLGGGSLVVGCTLMVLHRVCSKVVVMAACSSESVAMLSSVAETVCCRWAVPGSGWYYVFAVRCLIVTCVGLLPRRLSQRGQLKR